MITDQSRPPEAGRDSSYIHSHIVDIVAGECELAQTYKLTLKLLPTESREVTTESRITQ